MFCACAEKQAPYHIAGICGPDAGIVRYTIRRYLLRIQRDQWGPRAAGLGYNVLNQTLVCQGLGWVMRAD